MTDTGSLFALHVNCRLYMGLIASPCCKMCWQLTHWPLATSLGCLCDVTPDACGEVQVLAILEEYYVNGDIQDAATTLQASLGCTCDLLMAAYLVH